MTSMDEDPPRMGCIYERGGAIDGSITSSIGGPVRDETGETHRRSSALIHGWNEYMINLYEWCATHLPPHPKWPAQWARWWRHFITLFSSWMMPGTCKEFGCGCLSHAGPTQIFYIWEVREVCRDCILHDTYLVDSDISKFLDQKFRTIIAIASKFRREIFFKPHYRWLFCLYPRVTVKKSRCRWVLIMPYTRCM